MSEASLVGQLRKGLRYFFGEQFVQGFAGGLNLRDAPTELAVNESPGCWNVTLDERGGVVKRLGHTKWNTTPAANLIQDTYHSVLTSRLFWYSPADGCLYSDEGNGALALRHTFTAGSRISLVDFAGKLYAVHPVDGLYESTAGLTWAATVKGGHSTNIPKGTLLAVWQNKLWVAGADGNKLWFSAPGDATDWDTADLGGSVNVREKNDTAIVALHGGSGFDFQSQPGLFVFKNDSTYRVIDSDTGAYITVDGMVGAAGKNAVTELYGELIILSRRGVYMTKKQSAVVPAAEKIAPLFDPSSLDDTKMANWCVGYKGDRVYLSVTRQGSSVNDLALEFAPLYGWVAPGSNAMGVYQTLTGNSAETLLGGSPTTAGQIYQLQTGGADDTADIASWFTSKWLSLQGTHQARMNNLKLLGRGYVTVTTRTDFALSGGYAEAVNFNRFAGSRWGTATWGTDRWGGPSLEDYLDVRPRTIGRSFQIRIDETSSLTFTNPELLGTGAALQAGAWALYGIDAQFAPLGLN